MTTSVDPDEVRRRARERQEQQTAALDAILDARYAAIAALDADAKAMKAGEAAGLTAEQLLKDGVPPLPAIAPAGEPEKPARRPRGSGRAPRAARSPRAAASPAAGPAAAGNGGGGVHGQVGVPQNSGV